MPEPAPFDQLPFDELPDQPRRPHGYASTEACRLEVSTPSLGTLETHYRRLGAGPPLLLVHGLMTSSYSWRYVFEPLAEHFTVIAPDLPGAGYSDKPLDVPYDPRAFAEWIAAFQRAVDIRGCPVVGNSLGGYLCMWLALRDPGAIDRLVNLHSPGVPTRSLKLLGYASALPGLQQTIAWLARRRPERWAHRHVHYFDESLKSRQETRHYAEALADRPGSLAFAKALTETLDVHVMGEFVELLEQRRDRGDGFPLPLLLLYAEQDRMVPPEVGQKISRLIPQADYRTMPEASHFAHIDAPRRFLRHVFEFLGVEEPTAD